MANGILVFIEHVNGKINRATYEALRAAQLIGAQTGQAISAVILGQNIGAAASEIAGKKITAGHTVESEWLKSYTADGYTVGMAWRTISEFEGGSSSKVRVTIKRGNQTTVRALECSCGC